MKARDVLHHATPISNKITLKPIQICVCWDFQPSQYKSMHWSYQRLNTNYSWRSSWVKSQFSDTTHVELTFRGWLYFYDQLNNTTFVIYILCWIHAQVHQNRQTLIEKYHKQYLPDIAHINWNNTLRSTGINSWNPQMYPYEKEKWQPGCQDLRHTVAQASKNLEISTVLQLDWFLTKVYELCFYHCQTKQNKANKIQSKFLTQPTLPRHIWIGLGLQEK